MGWLLANLFLLSVVLVTCGYCAIAFQLLKGAGWSDNAFLVLIAFGLALVATYHTMKYVHAFIAKRLIARN